mgnify:CR=1 FL=1
MAYDGDGDDFMLWEDHLTKFCLLGGRGHICCLIHLATVVKMKTQCGTQSIKITLYYKLVRSIGIVCFVKPVGWMVKHSCNMMIDLTVEVSWGPLV